MTDMSHKPVNPAPLAWMTDPLVLKAFAFATEAHKDQIRKYTKEPYIYHPMEVAQILVDAFPTNPPPPFVLAAALLHDTVEDCGVTFTELRREFDDQTAIAVMHLTDLVTKDQGNRDTRKYMECARMQSAPLYAQTIKIADMISNTRSIVEHDKDFAVVYLKENERLLGSIISSWIEDDSIMSNKELRAHMGKAIGQVISPEHMLASMFGVV